jgi:hypothetical protein
LLQICAVFFLLFGSSGKAFADFGVELDIVFKDSTNRYQFLHVLGTEPDNAGDTLAVFDTLSFNRQRRVSLFYTVSAASENIISVVDTAGKITVSKPFDVSPRQTTFVAVVDAHQIKVAGKDYLYPRKNEDPHSYFYFLLIFFIVKVVITAIYIFTSKLPERLIFIASGAYLLSAFIDWFLPLQYLFRFLAIVLIEFLLIALFGRKAASPLRIGLLIIVVNAVGFGFIILTYLLYVFW